MADYDGNRWKRQFKQKNEKNAKKWIFCKIKAVELIELEKSNSAQLHSPSSAAGPPHRDASKVEVINKSENFRKKLTFCFRRSECLRIILIAWAYRWKEPGETFNLISISHQTRWDFQIESPALMKRRMALHGHWRPRLAIVEVLIWNNSPSFVGSIQLNLPWSNV